MVWSVARADFVVRSVPQRVHWEFPLSPPCTPKVQLCGSGVALVLLARRSESVSIVFNNFCCLLFRLSLSLIIPGVWRSIGEGYWDDLGVRCYGTQQNACLTEHSALTPFVISLLPCQCHESFLKHALHCCRVLGPCGGRVNKVKGRIASNPDWLQRLWCHKWGCPSK